MISHSIVFLAVVSLYNSSTKKLDFDQKNASFYVATKYSLKTSICGCPCSDHGLLSLDGSEKADSLNNDITNGMNQCLEFVNDATKKMEDTEKAKTSLLNVIMSAQRPFTNEESTLFLEILDEHLDAVEDGKEEKKEDLEDHILENVAKVIGMEPDHREDVSDKVLEIQENQRSLTFTF